MTKINRTARNVHGTLTAALSGFESALNEMLKSRDAIWSDDAAKLASLIEATREMLASAEARADEERRAAQVRA